MTFAGLLKKERDRLGLTQSECAAILDISERKLWAWENGKDSPSKAEQHGVLPILQKTKPTKK